MSERKALPTHTASESQPKPFINVTPLIDVLLVMLIIFMVVSPLKPARFLAQVPTPPDRNDVKAAELGLVVTINQDRSLMLNRESGLGSVDDTSKLSARLAEVFQQRLTNHAYRFDLKDRFDLPDNARIEKTVFIKAPGSIPYGEVVRVLDGIKGAGASPVGLQIDGLNQ